MQKALSIILILLLVSSLYASYVFSEYSAAPQTDRVIISWTTKNETNIKNFIVLRSNDDRTFIKLKTINPKGPGTQYTYIDENVMFKDASALFYKVKAVGRNGQALEESDAMIVHPNISGIFRTWGAIKAMFR